MLSRTIKALFFITVLLSGTDANAGKFLLGYPGSTWGNLTNEKDSTGGLSEMGNVIQGIDWYKFPNDIIFNTYAAYRLRSRNINRKYYDAQGPAVGIEFRMGPISVGYELYEENLPVLGETSHNREYYASGYFGWDLKRAQSLGRFKYPGSFWFFASYDDNGINGSGLMASIDQGIKVYTFPRRIDLIPFVEYRYRTRTRNRKYYDAQGFAIGMKLSRSPFSLGLNYYWEEMPVLGEHSYRLQCYFTWYISWDLMKRFRR